MNTVFRRPDVAGHHHLLANLCFTVGKSIDFH